MIGEDSFVTADEVSTLVYCPRKLWLRSRGEKAHTADTVRGLDQDAPATEQIPVADPVLGVHGVCDVVRAIDDGVHLIERKSVRKDRPPHLYPSFLAQLAVYRHCLRTEDVRVHDVSVRFTEHRRTVPVDDADLDAIDVPALVAEARSVLFSNMAPEAFEEDDPRCRGCSLFDVCRPESPRAVPSDPLGAFLVVDDRVRHVRVRRGQFLVDRDGVEEDTPSLHVGGIVVTNERASITTPALMLAAQSGITVVYDVPRSPASFLAPIRAPRSDTRCRIATLDILTRMTLAREMIRAKVLNQAARVRASHPDAAKWIRDECRRLDAAETASEIFGVEGACADRYFEAYFDDLPSWASQVRRTRVKHGAADPGNLMLNYGYGVLRAAVTRSVVAAGLDPAAGVLHVPGRNPSPMSDDLMEQFRAPVVDSAVRGLVNRGTVTKRGFTITRNGLWAMTKNTKYEVAQAVLDMLSVEHRYAPETFPMTWSRTIEYQVRTLIQFLDGTRPVWRGVYVR